MLLMPSKGSDFPRYYLEKISDSRYPNLFLSTPGCKFPDMITSTLLDNFLFIHVPDRFCSIVNYCAMTFVCEFKILIPLLFNFSLEN